MSIGELAKRIAAPPKAIGVFPNGHFRPAMGIGALATEIGDTPKEIGVVRMPIVARQ